MKRIQYKCEVRSRAWQAEIKIFTDVYPIEAVITGRGYAFHIIYGNTQMDIIWSYLKCISDVRWLITKMYSGINARWKEQN